MLWMNTVGPYHNRQETYNYFSLPFCKGEKTTISHYHEGLADAIQGVELEFSGLDIAFKGLTLTNQALYIRGVYSSIIPPPPRGGKGIKGS